MVQKSIPNSGELQYTQFCVILVILQCTPESGWGKREKERDMGNSNLGIYKAALHTHMTPMLCHTDFQFNCTIMLLFNLLNSDLILNQYWLSKPLTVFQLLYQSQSMSFWFKKKKKRLKWTWFRFNASKQSVVVNMNLHSYLEGEQVRSKVRIWAGKNLSRSLFVAFSQNSYQEALFTSAATKGNNIIVHLRNNLFSTFHKSPQNGRVE